MWQVRSERQHFSLARKYNEQSDLKIVLAHRNIHVNMRHIIILSFRLSRRIAIAQMVLHNIYIYSYATFMRRRRRSDVNNIFTIIYISYYLHYVYLILCRYTLQDH